jgi:hypothetical protein
MAWMVSGGQVIVDLLVPWLSGIWDEVPQAYMASQPLPMTRMEMAYGVQRGQKAA